MTQRWVARVGAQALAATPSTRFSRKAQLRMAAREAFAKSSNLDALRRAELRQVRPSRGPFPVGSFVFYYDASSTKEPGPQCWRGVARVVGHEGSQTIWISHRGILLAVSPEHLSRAFDEEVEAWTVTGKEVELIDPMPASGGTGFIDLRKRPLSLNFLLNYLPVTLLDYQKANETRCKKRETSYNASERPETFRPLLRQHFATSPSETQRRRGCPHSSLQERRPVDGQATKVSPTFPLLQLDLDQRTCLSTTSPTSTSMSPTFPEWNPEVHDYHTPVGDGRLSTIREAPDGEMVERENKRQRVIANDESANYVSERVDPEQAVSLAHYLRKKAMQYYRRHEVAFAKEGVSLKEFLFGVQRNDFSEHYEALSAGAANETDGQKKKGRKEIKLYELPKEKQELFVGAEGSDSREWKAWQDKEACDVLSLGESLKVRRSKPDLIVPTRWVRTNKNDGLVGADFLAKSRLLVQGFKDKSLGQYRRDAPTASAIAESICLAVCTHFQFVWTSKMLTCLGSPWIERSIWTNLKEACPD